MPPPNRGRCDPTDGVHNPTTEEATCRCYSARKEGRPGGLPSGLCSIKGQPTTRPRRNASASRLKGERIRR